MLGQYWSRVTAGLAVLVGIAALSYELAGAAQPPSGPAAAVEFTPDGRLKNNIGPVPLSPPLSVPLSCPDLSRFPVPSPPKPTDFGLVPS